MMQNFYFGDMFADYVAGDDTSIRHVDVFQFCRHDVGNLLSAETHGRERRPARGASNLKSESTPTGVASLAKTTCHFTN
jgi:hypothetical protein